MKWRKETRGEKKRGRERENEREKKRERETEEIEIEEREPRKETKEKQHVNNGQRKKASKRGWKEASRNYVKQ